MFTCVSIGFGSTTRVVERNAPNAGAAAEAHAKAQHRANWTEHWRDGQDLHGAYQEFTVKQGSRANGTVRVYKEYK